MTHIYNCPGANRLFPSVSWPTVAYLLCSSLFYSSYFIMRQSSGPIKSTQPFTSFPRSISFSPTDEDLACRRHLAQNAFELRSPIRQNSKLYPDFSQLPTLFFQYYGDNWEAPGDLCFRNYIVAGVVVTCFHPCHHIPVFTHSVSPWFLLSSFRVRLV